MSSSSIRSATATAAPATTALALPALVVAYLALVREARPAGSADAEWRSWYRYFPWEDWREGRPALLDPIEAALARWARQAGGEAERRLREERVGLAFGLAFGHGAAWNEELVLERYELLYEAGLVRRRCAISAAPARPLRRARRPGRRWRSTIAAFSPPRSAGCAARSSTVRSCSS